MFEQGELKGVSRREVLVGAAVAGVGVMVAGEMTEAVARASTMQAGGREGVALRFLEKHAVVKGGGVGGVTFGLPWPKGTVKRDEVFALTDEKGQQVAVQTWPTAYWGDGSVKWTAHATAVGSEASTFTLLAGQSPAKPTSEVQVAILGNNNVSVNTGAVEAVISGGLSGPGTLLESLKVNGQETLTNGRLVVLLQDGPSVEGEGAVSRTAYTSLIEKTTVEQRGPVRAVVKVEGKHVVEKGYAAGGGVGGRQVLPFVVRLYFYAGSPQVRMMHTFIYDLDETKDFLAGIGVKFDVPMRDAMYDRHVRFVGKEKGVWAEAVQGLTGLRRDPGREVRAAQVAGKKVPGIESWAAAVRERVQYIPVWGDYSLRQLSADGFDIRKRTKPGHAWIPAAFSSRASGTAYVGGASGGVAFGLRDFWQRHPTGVEIRGANTDKATVSIWMYSPDAPAMDLRFYHDGMGQDTFKKQYDGGLAITYEDYEPGFGTPEGVARTSEVYFWPVTGTPSNEALVQFADGVRTPPLLVATPEHYAKANVFGGVWKPVDRSNPQLAKIEDHLDFLLSYYIKEVEQRHWYGFWDYGDVMHTQDDDRHVWRYDVGGYAWDNSELSPDLWIWYSFLRTGRADVFRFGEAMIRHTTDVDSYHSGKFKLLGTRHNVMHWGCSAKQLRISTPIYRRFYYFLTADERIGDFLHMMKDADTTFLTVDPGRKLRAPDDPYKPDPKTLAVGFGTDWGSAAISFLTEYERTEDPKMREKILNGMKSIGAAKWGFWGGAASYDLATGIFTSKSDAQPDMSHLSAAFGLPETCAELIQNFEVPEFEKAWLDYAQYYNAPRDVRRAALGVDLRNGILVAGHARCTAYAAVKKKDAELAKRAWIELIYESPTIPAGGGGGGRSRNWLPPLKTTKYEGPEVLNPIEEARLSTNGVAQWGTAAVQLLALVPEAVPEIPEPAGPLGG